MELNRKFLKILSYSILNLTIMSLAQIEAWAQLVPEDLRSKSALKKVDPKKIHDASAPMIPTKEEYADITATKKLDQDKVYKENQRREDHARKNAAKVGKHILRR